MDTVSLRRRSGAVAITVFAAAGLLSIGSQATAGGFALKEGSASAQGTSFAGATSASTDITHSFWNPAAMRETKTITIAGSLSYVSPDSEGTITNNVSGAQGAEVNGSIDAVVPGTYFGMRLTEEVVLGVTFTAPFGLATEYDPGDFGALAFGDQAARRSALTAVQIAPILSYDVTPNFTIAGGPTVLLGKLVFETNANAGVESNLELDVSGSSVGWQIGALFEPIGGTQFGIAYRSDYSLTATGDSFGTGAFGAAPVVQGRFSADLPGILTAGVTQDVGEDFKLMLEFQWQRWSVLEEAFITSQQGLTTEGFNYDDAFLVAFGGEYDLSEEWVLRSGVAWDQTPTTDEERTARIADTDRLWLSIGAGFKLSEGMKIDAAYSFLYGLDDVTAKASGGSNITAEFEGTAHVLTIGGQVDF